MKKNLYLITLVILLGIIVWAVLIIGNQDKFDDVVRYNCELSAGEYVDGQCICPFEEAAGQTSEMMYDRSTGFCQTTAGGPGGDAFAASVGLPYGDYSFWYDVIHYQCEKTGGAYSNARCTCSEGMVYDESTGLCQYN